MIDAEDIPLVCGFSWHCTGNGYAIAYKRGSNAQGKPVHIAMHRLLTNAPTGIDVDHKNGNKSDNRRSNLRLCTRALNNANSKTRPSISGMRGVHPNKRGSKTRPWFAKIVVNETQISLGTFPTKEAAYDAYKKAAIHYFGEFAYENR